LASVQFGSRNGCRRKFFLFFYFCSHNIGTLHIRTNRLLHNNNIYIYTQWGVLVWERKKNNRERESESRERERERDMYNWRCQLKKNDRRPYNILLTLWVRTSLKTVYLPKLLRWRIWVFVEYTTILLPVQ